MYTENEKKHFEVEVDELSSSSRILTSLADPKREQTGMDRQRDVFVCL